MVSFLRHISIRIWIGLLLGGLTSFLVLPMLQLHLGLEYNVYVAAGLVVFFCWVGGWLMTRWALNTSKILVTEAAAFERDGMYEEAEGAFRRALAIFDSFLIPPSVKRKKSGNLGSRLARFYLARSSRDQVSEDFLISYLRSHPQDEDVAEQWLRRIENSGGLEAEHQELIERIGDAQPQNMHIQRTLGRFYLLLERTDFPALQTYRRISTAEDIPAAGFSDDLARLFAKEGRADEWALEIYLKALAGNFKRPEYLRGLAACLHWIPAGGGNRKLLQSARLYLKPYDAAAREKMRQGFKSPVLSGQPPTVQKKRKRIATLIQTLVAIYRGLPSILEWIFARVETAFHRIQHSRKIRRVLTAMLLVGLVSGIGALVMNTVGHLSLKEESAPRTAQPQLPIITDPFTVQVAAYLQSQYAKDYVQKLNQQGVDAYWSVAVSGDKRWYQVRVAHFATKQAARDFGEKLKSQGIIEDFYVANYRPH